ncbi:MAG: epoxyqueuosine reductase [Candidatus Bathyarchaeota archaeon]|nr:MAG: epoxyqueuosine reductase [Candidatus Bathyarchaeota archaeon]
MSQRRGPPRNLRQLRRLIREKAIKWGADLVGFADAKRFNRYGEGNRPPSETKTVIVLGIWMEDQILDLWLHTPSWKSENKPSRAFEDEILRGTSLRISLMLEQEGFWAEPAPYEPGLYLKEAGVLAGLGVIGKNNLLITEEYGPRIRLRALNTNASLKADQIIEGVDYCRECNMCVKACPANALSSGKYNKKDCLSYCENNLTEISRYSVLWCMECSSVCPVGKSRERKSIPPNMKPQ